MAEGMFDPERFVRAQAPVFASVLRELGAGAKRTHWMWFVFPQVAGLAFSETSRFYALPGLDAARAYRAHPLLGARLMQSTLLANQASPRSARQVFGTPDDLKFRSSMTLFAQADPAEPAFEEALRLYVGGQPDERTLEILAAG